MASAKGQRIGIALAGLAFSAIFAVLAFRRLDVASVLATLRDARVLPWVPLAILAYVAGHFVRGARLRLLVRGESALSLATATNVVVVGYASNNVFPARLGELVRAGLLTERTGIPVAQSLTVTFIERLLDGIAILVMLLVGDVDAPGPAGLDLGRRARRVAGLRRRARRRALRGVLAEPRPLDRVAALRATSRRACAIASSPWPRR